MEHARSDGSGTDDDLPPHQNRNIRGGRISGNGRYSRGQIDMESQIHLLEQEAYISVLRAFKAQSDAITWEKEGLITELRKELRVSDDEHRELLSRVNADNVIKGIREWRQGRGPQSGLHNNVHPLYDSLASPSMSGSRKRQKTSRPIPSVSLNAQTTAAPSSSATFLGSKSRYPSSKLTGVSTMRSLQLSSTNINYANANASTEPAARNPLIGKKVWTRWPDDNNFYEAFITDYNAVQGTHALVYDIHTVNEAWEWVNLKEISPDDIRWEAPETGQPMGQSRADRGKVLSNNLPSKDLTLTTNGLGNKNPDEIEILNTETVIKEVENVIASSHPDPYEIEKAKKTLREHEQSLIDAIAKLAEASVVENDDGNGTNDNPQWNQHGTYVEERLVA